MRKLISKKTSKGFSLLEILVAFSILALSLGVLFQIYALGTTATILGEEYAQAILIAESRLAELSVIENIGMVETDGTEGDKYEWKVSVEDYVNEATSGVSATVLLKQVNVTVTWASAGGSRSVNLQTLKPVPAA